jgi:hypothetical protein
LAVNLVKKIFSKLARRLRFSVRSKRFALEGLEEVAERLKLRSLELLPEAAVCGHQVKFFPSRSCTGLSFVVEEKDPGSRMFTFENVSCVGRTELVLVSDKALFPKPFDPQSFVFMLEIEGRARVLSEGRILKLETRSSKLHVKAAVSLLGQCNGNYAHWVLEVLTRLCLIDAVEETRGLPVLIDWPVHESLLRAFDVMNASGRAVIRVQAGQEVMVEKLYYLTSPSFTPPETRSVFERGELGVALPTQFQFSRVALSLLRRRALEVVDRLFNAREESCVPWFLGTSRSRDALSERFFINRNPASTGNGRHVMNGESVRSFLETQNFVELDLASMPFEHQVAAVQSGRVFVAPLGAACVNLVFARPGATVVLLSPTFDGANWYYWSNLMIAMGHRLIVVTGPQVTSGSANLQHRDYWVPLSAIREGLEEAL